MKKTIIIPFFLAFVLPGIASAQAGLNISSGINISNVAFTNFEDVMPESGLGYFIEATPGFQINEKMQILINFQYSLQGYKTGIENSFTASEFKYAYLYLLPEMEYYIFEHLALGLGVNYGLKLNEQYKFGTADWSYAKDLETIHSSDFGLSGKLKARYRNIFGYIRYNAGLKNISGVILTNEEGQDNAGAKQFNRNVQVGIGYSFAKDKKRKSSTH